MYNCTMCKFLTSEKVSPKLNPYFQIRNHFKYFPFWICHYKMIFEFNRNTHMMRLYNDSLRKVRFFVEFGFD
jgi:hypothetical protein